MKKNIIFLLITFFLLPWATHAHPGRTDASGCHTCRTNCSNWGLSTGEYHCHNAKTLPQPEAPIRSHYGEGGTGTTEPWPDYESSKLNVSPTVVAPIKENVQPIVPIVSPITIQPKRNWFIRLFDFLF